MRTLPALLTALLLLASQARAQALQEAAGQVPAQDLPVAKDQDMPAEEDEDEGVAISFTAADGPAQGAPGHGKHAFCHCPTRKHCNFPERRYGTCKVNGLKYNLCCR